METLNGKILHLDLEGLKSMPGNTSTSYENSGEDNNTMPII